MKISVSKGDNRIDLTPDHLSQFLSRSWAIIGQPLVLYIFLYTASLPYCANLQRCSLKTDPFRSVFPNWPFKCSRKRGQTYEKAFSKKKPGKYGMRASRFPRTVWEKIWDIDPYHHSTRSPMLTQVSLPETSPVPFCYWIYLTNCLQAHFDAPQSVGFLKDAYHLDITLKRRANFMRITLSDVWKRRKNFASSSTWPTQTKTRTSLSGIYNLSWSICKGPVARIENPTKCCRFQYITIRSSSQRSNAANISYGNVRTSR